MEGQWGQLELNGHQFIGVQWGYLWLRKSHYGAEGLNVGHWTSVYVSGAQLAIYVHALFTIFFMLTFSPQFFKF